MLTAYAKSQKTYEVVWRGDEKWGSGSPFFQKTRVISTQFTYKNVKSIAGSKGLSPLAGFGAEPQKNFAYTVSGMLDSRSLIPWTWLEAQSQKNFAYSKVISLNLDAISSCKLKAPRICGFWGTRQERYHRPQAGDAY